jgi:hypothetical protein
MQLARDRAQAGDVVGVLVGDQDRRERFVRASGGLEALEGFLAADAGVDQETGPLCGNQSCVAAAGRREDGNFNDAGASL